MYLWEMKESYSPERRQVVNIPVNYLQPREPESEAEEDSMATSSEESRAVGGVVTDNSLDYQAKKAWIQSAGFRELGELYTAGQIRPKGQTTYPAARGALVG